MKLLASILALNIFAFANTTMCYINNIKDISKVESKKFDGGECKGKYSIDDMKAKSWSVDDIKISKKDNGFDFIYILKKDIKSSSKIDYDKLSKVVEKNKKEDEKKLIFSNGEKIYKTKCQSCHGSKGELTPQNVSLAINKYDLDTLQDTMRAYTWNEQDKGFAMVMKPYADIVTPKDIKGIYEYLKSINK